MNNLKKEFYKLDNYSTKWEKYFSIYENILSKYKDKNITFVEIGIFNGGSLQLWKNFFGPKAKIIGIDINKECKKFEDKDKNIEVFIGNQSDVNFWEEFFNKVENVDIVLDDGGHTNLDQIVTTSMVVEKINDGGMLIVEDTHTSYLKEYNSSSSRSFINFTKNLIDDLNSNIDLKLELKNKFSLKKYIYSIQYFESVVVFNIDRSKTSKNINLQNEGQHHAIHDLSQEANEIFIKKISAFLKKIPLIRLNKLTKFIKKKSNDKNNGENNGKKNTTGAGFEPATT